MVQSRVFVKPEDALQISIIEYMAWKYPGILVIHVPNGGSRNIIEATKLKRMGVKAGMPDIFIPLPKIDKKAVIDPSCASLEELNYMYENPLKGCFFNGFFCELKAGKNKPTKIQKDMMQKLIDLGYYCCVCYSLDEYIKEWEAYVK